MCIFTTNSARKSGINTASMSDYRHSMSRKTQKTTMFWVIIFLTSSSYALQQTLQVPTCTTQGTSRTVRLTVNSTRQSTGDWMDNISAWTEVSNSHNTTQMEIAHTITECQGKRIINIQALNQAPRYEKTIEKLKFHPRCGKNIAIVNNGLTVQAFNLDENLYSSAFTNRPLRDNELFEIVTEGNLISADRDFGVGIMTKSPSDVEILAGMWESPFVWIYHRENLYNNRQKVQSNIGKNTFTFQTGDRVGVMRTESGTLHTFYNGKDQGPAMSNVPPNVYGVLDLRVRFPKASII